MKTSTISHLFLSVLLLAGASGVTAQPGTNMPPLLDCVRCYTTEEEITSVLTEVFGTYTEPPLI